MAHDWGFAAGSTPRDILRFNNSPIQMILEFRHRNLGDLRICFLVRLFDISGVG